MTILLTFVIAYTLGMIVGIWTEKDSNHAD